MGWGSNPHAASSARLTAVFLTIRSTHEHPNNRKAQILDSGLGPFQFYHSLLGKNLSETLVRTCAITGWLRRLCRCRMCESVTHEFNLPQMPNAVKRYLEILLLSKVINWYHPTRGVQEKRLPEYR